MFFYLFLFIFICFFSFICSFVRDKNAYIVCLVMIFFLLWIPAAFRKGIGTDYQGYLEIFERIKKGGSHSDFGYYYLNKLIYNFGLSPQWIFVIMSFLTYFFFINSVPKKKIYISIPIFYLLFYTASYNIVRQICATMIVYNAFKQISKKKYFLFMLEFFLAYSFHKSTLVFLLFLVFWKKRKLENFTIVFICFLFLLTIFIDIRSLLLTIINITPYKIYNNLFEDLLLEAHVTYGIIPLLRFSIAFFLFPVLPKSVLGTRAKIGLILYMVACVLGRHIILLQRFEIGFSIFIIYAIEVICISKASKYSKICTLFTYIIIFLIFFLRLFAGADEVIPYTSIFN